MLKLYGAAFSRASIVKWYLEELNVPYEFVMLDMKAGEHKQPEYLQINPMGKVPAIADGDFKLWESGAILLYLAEKYGKMPDSIEYRSIINQWVYFGSSTLGNGLFIEANREKEMPQLLNSLNEILSGKPFLLGEEFTVADVAVGSILAFGIQMLKLDYSDYPAVSDYVKRLTERSVYKNTIAQPTV